MELKEKYIRKYWYEMVVEQLKDQYKDNGYNVSLEAHLNQGLIADMIVEKDGVRTIVEIVTNSKTPQQIIRIKQLAEELHYEFQLVVANYSPLRQNVEFEQLPSLIVKKLNEDVELYELPEGAMIDNASDLEYKDVFIDGNRLYVKGTFEVEVVIPSPDNEDQEFIHYYPATFDLLLKHNRRWIIEEVNQLTINRQ